MTADPGEAGLAGFCAPCWEHSGKVRRPLPERYAVAVEGMTGGKVPAYACPLVLGVWHIDAGVTARVAVTIRNRFAGKEL